MKQCNKCNEVKSLDQYQIRTDTGRPRSECKTCRDQYANNRYSTVCATPKISITTKCCNVCKQDLPTSEFGKFKGTVDGFTQQCKRCRSVQTTTSYEKNKEPILKKQREYYQENSEVINEKSLIRYYENHEERLEQKREYNKSDIGRENNRNWQAKETVTNPYFKTKKNVRNRYRTHRNACRKAKTVSAISSLPKEFKDFDAHLRQYFVTGMDWNNYGKGAGKWHLDHYIPLDYFKDKPDMDNVATHYLNLRPLWEEDNLKKKDTLPEDYLLVIEKIKKVINE